MLRKYFKNLYQLTMDEAYTLATQQIFFSLRKKGNCLDCGAGSGHWYQKLAKEINLAPENYYGIGWD